MALPPLGLPLSPKSFQIKLGDCWMLFCCSGNPLNTGANREVTQLNVQGRLHETGSSFLFAPEGAEGVGYLELGRSDGLLYQPILIEILEGTLNSRDLVSSGKEDLIPQRAVVDGSDRDTSERQR